MGLKYAVFRVVRRLVRAFYPKPEIVGAEHLPEGACIMVGNHAQMNGPIIAELYLPEEPWIWCNGEMMHLKEVPDFAYKDFWSRKPVAIRWFYRLLSYIIAPLSVCVFNSARCIGVYHDARVMSTMRQSLKRLVDGGKLVIFPEHEPRVNHILYTFHDRFIDLGHMYFRQSGKSLAFVPMYIAPRLKKVFLGEPIWYNPEANPAKERTRVISVLSKAVYELAVAQPRHEVVPFRDVPGEEHPFNA